ncbi:hypothetical protein HK098_003261 [Nowakowskiella sp. JEL0407]|nr:hypothetical protein HK098_003261 [Nowakowskiella sp. JEL0407]
MSIDNLPTEMPLEASEHFSASLFPFIKELIVGNFSHPVLSRATITFESGLTEKFKKLEKHIKLSASSPTNATKRVLVLGSGFVAGPLVDYLAGVNNYSVTVATNNLNEAKLISSNKSNVYVKEFDVSDAELLNNLISESDVVVSLLPASFHVGIAKSCIRHGKNLVTASYVSPEMQSLHELAKSSKVLLLNEIGLDPGIDHMSTMKRLASLSPDEKVISYKSWCGGLPAPEHTLKSISPIGYKFSWSPKGVLLATLKGAKYIDSKRMTEIPEGELMENVKDIEIFKGFSFEGIPNRDSIKYQRIYGLEGNQVETFFRGTLRYKGFCDVMKWCQQLKLLDSTQVDLSRVKSWNEYIMKTSPNLRTNEIPPDVKETLNWLGIFSDSKRFVVKETALDSFCELLKEKLVYEKEERDMVCMHHEFIVKSAKNERVLQSTLILYGEPHGFSAMAKTVGLPAAIATKLIMEGKITETGVVRPTIKEIYDPVLKELDKLEIKFVENESRK